MKKTLAVVLALILCLGAVSALAETFGLGIVTHIDSSRPASVVDGVTTKGRGQVDTYICAVILDENGVIVKIDFDVAQTRVEFNPDGTLASDLAAEQLSKTEKGDGYAMKAASAIGKEWFEQVAEFEKYCVGKTAKEIIEMPTYARDESHTTVPDIADLKTTCTIDVGEFLDALEKAVANAF